MHDYNAYVAIMLVAICALSASFRITHLETRIEELEKRL